MRAAVAGAEQYRQQAVRALFFDPASSSHFSRTSSPLFFSRCCCPTTIITIILAGLLQKIHFAGVWGAAPSLKWRGGVAAHDHASSTTEFSLSGFYSDFETSFCGPPTSTKIHHVVKKSHRTSGEKKWFCAIFHLREFGFTDKEMLQWLLLLLSCCCRR